VTQTYIKHKENGNNNTLWGKGAGREYPWLGKEEADRESAPASVWAGETIFSGKGGDAR